MNMLQCATIIQERFDSAQYPYPLLLADSSYDSRAVVLSALGCPEKLFLAIRAREGELQIRWELRKEGKFLTWNPGAYDSEKAKKFKDLLGDALFDKAVKPFLHVLAGEQFAVKFGINGRWQTRGGKDREAIFPGWESEMWLSEHLEEAERVLGLKPGQAKTTPSHAIFEFGGFVLEVPKSYYPWNNYHDDCEQMSFVVNTKVPYEDVDTWFANARRARAKMDLYRRAFFTEEEE